MEALGSLLVMVASAASADDGTFAPEVLRRLTPEHRSRLGLIWADGKYNNRGLDRYLAGAEVGYRVEVGSAAGLERIREAVGGVR